MFGLPTARPSSRRCGHSTSTGATARNSGPGKSPLAPMPAWSSASCVTCSAIRSERAVEENGSTLTKSTVPAILVFRPSTGKRVMVRMPDSPATSFAQLSALPAPSEVMMPMPVTTTTGRPSLSRGAVIDSPLELTNRLDQRHAFAAPVSGPHHDDLGGRPLHFNLGPGGIVRRKQRAARDRERCERNPERELRLHGVAEHRAGRAHRIIGMAFQESALL